MPNWCSNVLMFRGDKEEVDKLLNAVSTTETALSLDKIITTPQELKNASAPNRDEKEAERLEKLYGASDWYNFQVKNWGTKWDVNATISYDSHDTPVGWTTLNEKPTRVVSMHFESAWSPPTAAIDMLASKFPKVDIYHTFDEPGCDFSGYVMYSGGENVESKDWESWCNVQRYVEPDIDIFEYFPDKKEGEANADETASLANHV